jgi:hypothetical protein
VCCDQKKERERERKPTTLTEYSKQPLCTEIHKFKPSTDSKIIIVFVQSFMWGTAI